MQAVLRYPSFMQRTDVTGLSGNKNTTQSFSTALNCNIIYYETGQFGMVLLPFSLLLSKHERPVERVQEINDKAGCILGRFVGISHGVADRSLLSVYSHSAAAFQGAITVQLSCQLQGALRNVFLISCQLMLSGFLKLGNIVICCFCC